MLNERAERDLNPQNRFRFLATYSAPAVRSLSPVMNQEAAVRERFVVSDAIVIAFFVSEEFARIEATRGLLAVTAAS